ncbi:hypothetical protein C4D60_Mb09t19490 [Musa balbisiana]|uniref:Ribonucloprotein n=1 Tax=Musa balbisiana TaxID=52838 RepID=A0A4S8IHN3_MUSBA|nr:hypothetical protein C4D60_Mb09t19490 [Musa balbisiana]
MGSDSENKKSVERKKPMAVAPIAKPLAGKNLCKRTLKLVRRAAEAKSLKRGLKEVVKSDLAVAGVTKRLTCCVLVLTKPTKGELVLEVQEKLQADYNQVIADVKELTTSLF